jgi:hypothetical protein
MKVLVLFRLPDNKFVSCSLDKLAAFPVTGHTYLFNRQRYEVESAVEPLTSTGGHSQILDIVNLEFNNQAEAAAALASMVNLDDGDKKLDSTIVLAAEPDKVVLVRLKKPGTGAKARTKASGGFTLDIQGLLSGKPQAIDTSAPASGTRRTRKDRKPKA